MKEHIKEWLLEVLKLSILYIAVGFVAGVYSGVYGLCKLIWYSVPDILVFMATLLPITLISMYVVWISLEAKLNTFKLFKGNNEKKK